MLYLVRHGQTEFNAAGRWQGQCDSPLTTLGQAQALTIADILRREGLTGNTMLVSSPLGRATQTAAIIADGLKLIHPVTFDDRLKEVGMGAWDGLTSAEIDHKWPGARDGFGDNEWFFHSPDGESYEGMKSRVSAVLEELLRDVTVPKIVVCHGVTSRLVRGLHSGSGKAEMLDLEVPQDAVFRLSPDGAVSRLDRIATVPS